LRNLPQGAPEAPAKRTELSKQFYIELFFLVELILHQVFSVVGIRMVRAATGRYWRRNSDPSCYLDSVFVLPERTLSLNS
jgi:hypothetical protein